MSLVHTAPLVKSLKIGAEKFYLLEPADFTLNGQYMQELISDMSNNYVSVTKPAEKEEISFKVLNTPAHVQRLQSLKDQSLDTDAPTYFDLTLYTDGGGSIEYKICLVGEIKPDQAGGIDCKLTAILSSYNA